MDTPRQSVSENGYYLTNWGAVVSLSRKRICQNLIDEQLVRAGWTIAWENAS